MSLGRWTTVCVVDGCRWVLFNSTVMCCFVQWCVSFGIQTLSTEPWHIYIYVVLSSIDTKWTRKKLIKMYVNNTVTNAYVS